MDQDPKLIAELRSMVRRGVSVSRLVQRLLEGCRGQSVQTLEIIRAFRDAFQLDPSGLGVLREAVQNRNELAKSSLNWMILPRIIETRPLWDECPSRFGAWFDGLPKTPSAELRRCAEKSRGCGLSSLAWEQLNEQDRNAIVATEVSRLMLSEDVCLLAALVERLQTKLLEYEGRQTG
jgi:hypothetical protein